MQAYVITIIGMSGLHRLKKCFSFDWNNISKVTEQNGLSIPHIQMFLDRSKCTGPEAMKKFPVSDAVLVDILTIWTPSPNWTILSQPQR